jgi:hypothetical protein
MLAGGGAIFNTIKLWNDLTALGDASSARRFGLQSVKGEPQQDAHHSVTTTPAAFRELTIIDLSRR